jgi:hypothetical protein
MNRVIEGKRYDTTTAKLLAEVSENYPRDFDYCEEKLYRTKSGQFFLHGWGGAKSRYGEWHGNTGGAGEQIMPFSEDDAREWAELHMDADAYEKVFGAITEDSVKISADISESAKAQVDAIKARTGETTGALIERLLAKE